MSSESLQTVSNVIILVGASFGAVGGFGHFYFGQEATRDLIRSAKWLKIFSNVLILVGALLGAVGGFGRFYFGQNAIRDRPIEQSLSYVQLDAEQAFVESKLGVPQHRNKSNGKQQTNYLFEPYWLRLFYEGSPPKLVGYFVIARLNYFMPELPWPRSDQGPKDLRLGKVTFAQLRSEQPFSHSSDSGGQSIGPWYIETSHEALGSTNFTTILAGYFAEIGAPYPDSGDMIGVKMPWPEHPSAKDAAALAHARATTKPNAFGQFKDGHEPDASELVFDTSGRFAFK